MREKGFRALITMEELDEEALQAIEDLLESSFELVPSELDFLTELNPDNFVEDSRELDDLLQAALVEAEVPPVVPQEEPTRLQTLLECLEIMRLFEKDHFVRDGVSKKRIRTKIRPVLFYFLLYSPVSEANVFILACGEHLFNLPYRQCRDNAIEVFISLLRITSRCSGETYHLINDLLSSFPK